jgi:hypothetical protein
MTTAALSTEAIARVLETSSANVSLILQKPHVQRYLLALEATYSNDLQATAKRVNQHIIDSTDDAIFIEKTIMNDMFSRREEVPCAKLALACATDILDRAGATAPKKIDLHGSFEHSIDSDSLKEAIAALQDLKDITPEE